MRIFALLCVNQFFQPERVHLLLILYHVPLLNEHRSGKTGLNACPKSVVPDKPLQNALANEG